MANLDKETLSKLTNALTGDVDLYNKIVEHISNDNKEISERNAAYEELEAEKQALLERNMKQVDQINNLLDKIPVSESSTQKSSAQKWEEWENRSWD